MNRIAKVISYLFHPLFMPTYGVYVAFSIPTYLTYTLPNEFYRFIYSMVFLCTCLLPATTVLFLRYKNIISDLEISDYKQRTIPFLVTASFYLGCYSLLKQTGFMPQLVLSCTLGAFASIVLAFTITLKWKISAHMIGVGGLVGIIMGISVTYFTDVALFLMLSISVAALLAFARLQLNLHTPKQVYAGFLLGAATLFAFISFGIG